MDANTDSQILPPETEIGSRVDNVLTHHGIKGMKWGVRRADPSGGGSAKPKADSHASEEHKAAVVARSKPPSSLSNQEMQALITRLDLEKRYSQLTAEPPAPVRKAAPPTRKKKAAKFVADLLLDIGKQEITRVARGSASLHVENTLAKTTMGKKEFSKTVAERIGPSKKKKKDN